MIKVVDTPNPDTKKFVFDDVIVGEGSKEFKNKDGSLSLVDNLFDIGNIELIFLDKNFISVRKSKNASWENLTQEVLDILSKNINKDFSPLIFKEENEFTDDVSIRIEEVLNEKIRPAVAMDGGDIRLKSFKNGVAEVGGAAIDVFPVEPRSNNDEFVSPLRGLDQCLLTPHIGGSTEEAQENIGVEVAEKLSHYSDNGTTISAVNFPEVALPAYDGKHRLLHVHRNTPGIMSAINQVFSDNNVNVSGQYLQTLVPGRCWRSEG